jgi:hypothetical protein
MKLKKGGEYVGFRGWRCRALSHPTKRHTIEVRWITGPLKSREARVDAASLGERNSAGQLDMFGGEPC